MRFIALARTAFDFKADTIRRRFSNILKNQVSLHALSWFEVMRLPASSFIYVSLTSSAATSCPDQLFAQILN